MFDLSAVLKEAVARGASDVHFKAGSPPIFRIATKLVTHAHPPLSPDETEAAARSIVNKAQWASFLSGSELDVAHLDPAAGRFRTSIFRQRGMVGLVMRHVKVSVPCFRDLGLPPIIATLAIGFANAYVRPLLALLTMPLNCLTFGLFGYALSFLLFYIVGQIVPGFSVTVVGAVVGSLLLGIVSGILSVLLIDTRR